MDPRYFRNLDLLDKMDEKRREFVDREDSVLWVFLRAIGFVEPKLTLGKRLNSARRRKVTNFTVVNRAWRLQ